MASASLRPNPLPAPSLLPSSRAFRNAAKILTLKFSRRFDVRSSQGSSWEAEEARWIREEQRWLREEQRWLREESRWDSERQYLLREIEALKLYIEALKKETSTQETSVVDLISNLTGLLQSLKVMDLKPLAGSSPSQIPVQIEDKEPVCKEIRILEAGREKKEENKKRSLKKGSEGEDVRAMQEALQRLGFYSGEEDMEFSTFSSGTERAVKTWQASIGFTQDGIMNSDLLEALYRELQLQENSDMEGTTGLVAGKDGVNGSAQASITSVTEVSEIKQILLKDDDVMEAGIAERKVFLLGENRWEEPARLAGVKKQAGRDQIKCLACRGEGRLMCTECDGTGEPNIEPQFLEWVEEGANCPYCEGLGYTVCDVCSGKAIIT